MDTSRIPAERIRHGVAVQRVNVYDRDGVFIRQTRYVGTPEQARAWARLQTMHDTDPEWPALVAILRNQ